MDTSDVKWMSPLSFYKSTSFQGYVMACKIVTWAQMNWEKSSSVQVSVGSVNLAVLGIESETETTSFANFGTEIELKSILLH